MTTLGKSIVGIIIIGIIAFGGYYYTNSNNTNEEVEQVTTNPSINTSTTTLSSTTSQAVPAEKKMSFAQFIKQGGAYKCTINENSGTTSTKGIVYIRGDNVKGEIATQAEGKSVIVNFIVTGGFTYTWTSVMPTMGFKFKNNAEGQPTGDTSVKGNIWNPEQIGDYDCEVATVSEKDFVPPSTVNFTAY